GTGRQRPRDGLRHRNRGIEPGCEGGSGCLPDLAVLFLALQHVLAASRFGVGGPAVTRRARARPCPWNGSGKGYSDGFVASGSAPASSLVILVRRRQGSSASRAGRSANTLH